MVDYDLRKLSAPIESLRGELTEAYNRLDARWSEITKCLAGLPIPCTVSYKYDECDFAPDNFSCLTWKKWNGKKRICIEVYYYNPNNPASEHEVQTTPYEEWSGEERIRMLAHVPELFKAAEEQTKAFISKTQV